MNPTESENALISPESVKAIQDVRDYLSSVVVDVTIETEDQKVGAIALGNELQKKFKSLDGQRSTEKKVWDEKSKTVQAQFKPVLDQIEQKKSKLSQAVTIWDRKIEQQRIEKQRQIDDESNKKKAALEAKAGTQAERAEMYRKQVADTQEAYTKEVDPEKRSQLWRDLGYYQSKVSEFEQKSEVSQVAAQQVQAPVYQAELPAVSKGTRKLVVYGVIVKNKRDFVLWCVKTDNLHFLNIEEMKLKTRAKETEGANAPDGVEFTKENATSFSGR